MSLRVDALRRAMDSERANVRERGGNNRGESVERIIRYAQGVVGEPWCVDFIIDAYGRSGSRAISPGYPRAVRFMFPRPGITSHGARWGRAGDPIRFTFDHVGMVVGPRRLVRGKFVRCPRAVATHVLTVEGNTGPGGALVSDSKEGGDGVYRKHRPLSVVRDTLRVAR